MALSVAQQPIKGQLKTITIQSRTLRFQDLYFLNFVKCKKSTIYFDNNKITKKYQIWCAFKDEI